MVLVFGRTYCKEPLDSRFTRRPTVERTGKNSMISR